MSLLLAAHILAGTISVLSGAAALTFRKGGLAHRRAGAVFVAAMSCMALTAAALGRDFGNAVAAGMTIYMVSTAWVTVRRRENEAGKFEVAAFAAAALCAAGMAASAAMLAAGPQEPANPFIVPVGFIISGAVALAALGDLNVVLRRGLSGAQRITRHLWRMCFALLVAVGSFAAQGAEALPRAVPRAELLFSAMILVLVVMFYWIVRTRFTSWRAPAPRPS